MNQSATLKHLHNKKPENKGRHIEQLSDARCTVYQLAHSSRAVYMLLICPESVTADSGHLVIRKSVFDTQPLLRGYECCSF